MKTLKFKPTGVSMEWTTARCVSHDPTFSRGPVKRRLVAPVEVSLVRIASVLLQNLHNLSEIPRSSCLVQLRHRVSDGCLETADQHETQPPPAVHSTELFCCACLADWTAVTLQRTSGLTVRLFSKELFGFFLNKNHQSSNIYLKWINVKLFAYKYLHNLK